MPWSLPQSRQPELMDDPAIAEADHVHALRALARINAVSRTASGIAASVGRILAGDASHTDDPIVVDVACGGGDVTVDIARRLHRRGLRGVRVVGVDISPRAVEQSRALAARSGIDATFEVRDLLTDGCPPCEVAVSSLFLHHLDDTTATKLLGSMATESRCGVVVSDLIRSRVGTRDTIRARVRSNSTTAYVKAFLAILPPAAVLSWNCPTQRPDAGGRLPGHARWAARPHPLISPYT
jgi:2-polyprenyl-3-methyl-5-hydroxy-6-metoxy-1,4-benzoquinol methylase